MNGCPYHNDDEFSVEYQAPCKDSTNNATYITNAPETAVAAGVLSVEVLVTIYERFALTEVVLVTVSRFVRVVIFVLRRPLVGHWPA